MINPIQWSVALVTRNRPDSLKQCLESLRAQSLQPWEVVISDDSGADYALINEGLAHQFKCRYISGPQRGLYANRNHVALACQGTHIRTMDDDHMFPVGHFELCNAAVSSDPEMIWTTGEIGYINGHYHATSATATQLHPSGVGGPVGNENDNWAIADGSTIYPRTPFERGLRMLERFPYGSSYLEFGALLYRHGFHSRCIKGAMVEHYAEPATLTRGNDVRARMSHLYASLCYNIYFDRNYFRLTRYLISYLCVRNPSWVIWQAVPGLLKLACSRWKTSSNHTTIAEPRLGP